MKNDTICTRLQNTTYHENHEFHEMIKMAKTRNHDVTTPNNMIQKSSKHDTKIDVLWSTYHKPWQQHVHVLLTLLTTSTCQNMSISWNPWNRRNRQNRQNRDISRIVFFTISSIPRKTTPKWQHPKILKIAKMVISKIYVHHNIPSQMYYINTYTMYIICNNSMYPK